MDQPPSDQPPPSPSRIRPSGSGQAPSIEPPSLDRRWQAARCALGEVEPDLILEDAVVFNSLTAEFIPDQCVWIKSGLVARVSSVTTGAAATMDINGMVVLPGLLDTHTHVWGQVGVDEFVRHVLPTGVTTVLAETDELPRIAGRAGFDWVIAQYRRQPLRFFHTIAPFAGLTEEEEDVAPSPEDLAQLLADPRCLGIGEMYWNNLLLPGPQGERVRMMIARAMAVGKRAEGHTAGARDDRLQAYVALGPSSCHEAITEEQVRDRLRLGLWTMVRQGGVRKELDAVAGAFSGDHDLRRLVLVTDGQYPRGFLEEGYLDAAVRAALALGAPPSRVYQAVTINPAEHCGFAGMLGSLTPGAYADVVVIPSADNYTPQAVLCEGRVLFEGGSEGGSEGGRVLVEPAPVSYPPALLRTVQPPADWEAGGERLWSWPEGRPLRAMDVVSRLVTKETVITPEGRRGPVGLGDDVAALVAVDRVRGRGSFWGAIRGFGLTQGACGSTMCWDTGDLLVVGCDRESLRTVVDRLSETGGGVVYAVGSHVVAELVTAVCGLVSTGSMEAVAREIAELEQALVGAGIPWEAPLLTLSTLSTAAIPFFRVSHRGYVRISDRVLLSLEV